MKKITTLMCAVALWCSAQAQAPALHFGRDGKFRIAQFTDVHLDLGTPYRRAQAEKTIAQMRYILDAEHPDLVVFTGDVVTGKPAAEAWHRVLEPVAERNLPFCVVLGNHDAEQDIPRAGIGRIVTSYAGTLNTLNADGELADVVLEIAGRNRLRRCFTASIRTTIRLSRVSTVTAGSRRIRYAGTATGAPLYRGQRRETVAGAGLFPYRPARIRRCMAEPRQYACRPCRRG
ncbi:MAG: metallophosphoesterase [Alistipes sp.]